MPFGCVALVCLALSACTGSLHPESTIVADEGVYRIDSASRTPAVILQRAGLKIGNTDMVLNNGTKVAVDQAIPQGDSIHIQVVKPIPVLINGDPLLSTALTVGAAIRDQGIEIYAADLLDPPAETPLVAGLVISFTPAAAIFTTADGTTRPLRAWGASTGAALADAGISLQGLDATQPSETEPTGVAGESRLTRITEAMILEQDPIPYESVTTISADLELGLEQVLQGGSTGLAATITRIARQDGVEAARQAAQQIIILEPTDREIVRGTKLVEKVEMIDGISISYWRNLQMYATVYSPCNSGTADGSCSTGTASGRPAGKGIVAVDPGLYASLNGQRLYIPGYGFAVIGDVGGGYIIEKNLGISRYKWIDLGFDDDNLQDMTGWLSVYFLTPAPSSIPDVLR